MPRWSNVRLIIDRLVVILCDLGKEEKCILIQAYPKFINLSYRVWVELSSFLKRYFINCSHGLRVRPVSFVGVPFLLPRLAGLPGLKSAPDRNIKTFGLV